MTRKKKQILLISRNLLYGTTGLLLTNPITVIIIGIILFFASTQWLAGIYIVVVLFSRPVLKEKIKTNKVKWKKCSQKLNHNVEIFSRNEETVEATISTVSYFEVQTLNYSARLLLNQKQSNYVAMLLASYMIVIYYNTLSQCQIISIDSKSFTDDINSKVISDNLKYNNSINKSYKSRLEKKSYAVISKMRDIDNINNLTKYTGDLIIDYLEDKTYINSKINEYIYKSLNKFGTGFSDATIERNELLIV
jgi:hypothetical protein